MRLKRALLGVHKWIAVIVGVQLFVWTLSGLVMSFLPIEKVRGEDHIAAQTPVPLDGATGLIGADAAIAASGGGVTATTLTRVAGDPVWELRKADGGAALVDARSGALLSPIGEALARRVAAADFSGEGAIVSAELVTVEGGDYRGRLPAWRVSFADPDETRLYVAANDGRIAARRTATWRFYDFFWMLHIMDYETRENFNTPWLVLFALGGLAVAFTGLPLLWYAIARPLLARRRPRSYPA